MYLWVAVAAQVVSPEAVANNDDDVHRGLLPRMQTLRERSVVTFPFPCHWNLSRPHPSLDCSNVGEGSSLSEDEVARSVEHKEGRDQGHAVCLHYLSSHRVQDIQPYNKSLALKVSLQPVDDRPCR